ncbi:DNA-binding transcriptional regulator [Legionella sp. 16cNR16C]|uniref:helix-turn-helix domain-containing protein n=1 Tax=Legionella sp. 16cNR16C TaxID=2905656 RepID=UPI001E32C024|nr:helix-turn-helix domain-containing protein [Legionella sp. 16cNR16C]MCE3043470.1 helix-turn-helix domain-containing protein [Legionella sp. 16cNR16C]
MANRDIGNEIIEGMHNAIDYVRGHTGAAKVHKVEIPATIDVRAIREKLNLSRQQFADSYGFSSRTLQHWEQGDRSPHGAAKVLLLLLQREPATIAKILQDNN